jgi:hypothetical protein
VLVLALALLAAVLGGCAEDERPSAPTPPEAVGTARLDAQPRDGWRTEWFRTIAVDVPDDWGWSQGPLRSAGELVRCSGGGDDAAYVGRPVPASDLCMLLEHEQAEQPEHASLWFDAPIDPGVEELGGDWVRETVVVDGVGLTVTSDDPDLRAEVLGSARRQDDCPPDLSRRLPDRFDTTTEGPGSLLTAVVCGYRVLDEDRDAVPVLAYATVPSEADVRAVWQRRERAQDCLGEPTLTTDVVVLETTTHDDFGAPGAAPLTQRVVGLVACPLARRVVAPVVDAGLRATLGTYIGPMG